MCYKQHLSHFMAVYSACLLYSLLYPTHLLLITMHREQSSSLICYIHLYTIYRNQWEIWISQYTLK